MPRSPHPRDNDFDTGVVDGKILPKPLTEPPFAEGKKYDQGKTRWDLVPWEAVEPLADILTFGSQKYGDNSWQMVDNAVERYKAALFRHLVAWCKGEKKDPESGRSHLHHALTNIVFLIWFEMHGQFQKSGFKDDEEYMITEQKPEKFSSTLVLRSSLGPAKVNQFCFGCLNYVSPRSGLVSKQLGGCMGSHADLLESSNGNLSCPWRIPKK